MIKVHRKFHLMQYKTNNFTKMKKTIFLTILIIATKLVSAQSVEVTPLFGYTFSGTVEGYYGTYDLKNDLLYGARLDVEIADYSYFELSYRRNDPTLMYSTNNSGINDAETNTGNAHYMLGFLREFGSGIIKPYGVISAGTSRYWEKGKSDKRKWFFSTEFGVGAKIFITDYIGLRLQGSVTTPWDFAGGGIYWGIGSGGSGGSASLTFGVPIAHWDLSGGLIIKLPN